MNPKQHKGEKRGRKRTRSKSNPHPTYLHHGSQLELDHCTRCPRSKNPKEGRKDEDEAKSKGIIAMKDEEGEESRVGVDGVAVPAAPSSPPLRVLVVSSPLVLASYLALPP
jgi:hypothetical protein